MFITFQITVYVAQRLFLY